MKKTLIPLALTLVLGGCIEQHTFDGQVVTLSDDSRKVFNSETYESFSDRWPGGPLSFHLGLIPDQTRVRVYAHTLGEGGAWFVDSVRVLE